MPRRPLPVHTTEIAPGVFRIRHDFVSFHLVEEDGQAAVYDAGLRPDHERLREVLRALGMADHAVTDVVLTHSHVDHAGFAGWAEAELGASVHVHPRARKMAMAPTSKHGSEVGTLRYAHRTALWRTVLTLFRNGGLTGLPVRAPRDIAHGQVLDLPGRAQVLHTPGHCAGHCAFWLPERDVLLSGDALVTYDTYTGDTGPGILSRGVNDDSAMALASLRHFEAFPEATLVSPAHGEPWAGGLVEALDLARSRGIH